MTWDVAILGGGPAGIAAWMSCHARGLNAVLITNRPEDSNLAKAPSIDNYPGFVGISGGELLTQMYESAAKQGLVPVYGRCTAVMPMGKGYMLAVGSEVYDAETLIIAAGVAPRNQYPGENEYLGKGVSYCATCDGMLYRGRPVAVIGLTPNAEGETQFLRSIGCEAEYFDAKRARRYVIKGKERVTALEADGVDYPVDGIFILRSAVKPEQLLSGLETEDNHIRVNRKMQTNLPGVFAAGDCVGAPYQIAKAVGEGCTAALSAADYIAKERKL